MLKINRGSNRQSLITIYSVRSINVHLSISVTIAEYMGKSTNIHEYNNLYLSCFL